MKQFDKLTRLGRVRRMREVARLALDEYGLDKAEFRLVRVAGNTLFRVYDAKVHNSTESNSIFEPGQYMLRLHARS